MRDEPLFTSWVVESNDPGTGERLVQEFTSMEAAYNLYFYLVDTDQRGMLYTNFNG